MTDYTELKRLAEAATPGRNFDRLPIAGGGLKYECTGDDGSLVLKVDHKNDEWGFVGENSAADEEFFLACTPAEVLALIADLDEARNGMKHSCAIRLKKEIERLEGERDQLKAENEALRRERDARHPFKPSHEPAIGFTGCEICGVYTDHGGLPCPKMRATAMALSMENQRITPVEPLRVPHPLDAAMGKGEQS